ncbi:MAG: two-component sensor histidine kinase [Magnetovibrio sp.]|nr:two-component sensor histidine kinase [Magnetovibrio sp.]
MAFPIKTYLPKSLLGRSLMIIVIPLILLQLVSGIIFFESHWDKVSLRLARGVAGDIASVVNLLRIKTSAKNQLTIIEIAKDNMQLDVKIREGSILKKDIVVASDFMGSMLVRAMHEYVRKPFQIDTRKTSRHVSVDIQLANAVLHILIPRKRLFSSTVFVFVAWMVGISLILFGVATIFMRNQVKPIQRLAIAADDFGKGRDVSNFKPEGATEVRRAAIAFLAMRERILRQISQRTEMLAGVSHDLRTPLTRMRLQLEMLGNYDTTELKSDIAEMEHMLDGYLAFARGEGSEPPVPTNVTLLLQGVVQQARRKGRDIKLVSKRTCEVPLRPSAFKRCLTNILENAMNFGKNITVQSCIRGDGVEIIIDDDGPGIPEEKREEVFKPFYRIDHSRNPDTGGVGLGLSIARDVVRGSGGDIFLERSSQGGLRVRISLPF